MVQPITHCPTCAQPLVETPPCDALCPGLVADVLPTRCVLGAGHEGWHEGPVLWPGVGPMRWTER